VAVCSCDPIFLIVNWSLEAFKDGCISWFVSMELMTPSGLGLYLRDLVTILIEFGSDFWTNLVSFETFEF
jgi:hypothetical protein